MLDRLRVRLDDALLSLGSVMAKLGLSPTGWTFIGLIFAVLSGYSYGYVSGVGQLLAGLLIIFSGFFDLVDGAVARVTDKVSKRGAFLDSSLDRLGEVAIYAGILVGGFSSSLWILLALAFSLLVSYTRARAESLGTSLSGIGIGERSERLIILALLSIVGLVSYGVILVALIAAFTFLERTYRGSESLKEHFTPQRAQGHP